jgi:hypothetical protein
MVSGDLAGSTPVVKKVSDLTGIEAVIDALNLAATTDKLVVLPIENGTALMIFKVERTA